MSTLLMQDLETLIEQTGYDRQKIQKPLEEFTQDEIETFYERLLEKLPDAESESDPRDDPILTPQQERKLAEDLLAHAQVMGEIEEMAGVAFSKLIDNADEFLAENPPPREIILYPWLAEQSISLISAKRGVGKTPFVLSIIDAITRGQNFGPWKTIKPVRILYVDGEMVEQDLHKRLRLGSPEDRLQPLDIISNAKAYRKGIRGTDLLDKDWRDQLKDHIIRQGYKILVLDNMSALFPGNDELSKPEWDPIGQWFLSLRYAGISSIIIHHFGKDEKRGPRGLSAREDAIDISIELTELLGQHKQEGELKFKVRFTKARIPLEDQKSINPTEFSLIKTEGRVQWLYGDYEERLKDKIVMRLENDIPVKDIKKELKVSERYIYRIKNQLKKKVTIP